MSITAIKNKIDEISNTSLHTNKFGFARSLMAISTLSSLLCNDCHQLFAILGNATTQVMDGYSGGELSFGLFYLLRNHLLIAKIISVVLLLFVVSGYFPRFTGILHWYISWSYFNSTAIVDGGDQLISILTFLIIPICLTDSRKNHWLKGPTNELFNLTAQKINILNHAFLFIVKMQVCLLYFEASVGKFKVDEWANGTAIYYWLNQSWFGTPGYLKPLTDMVITNTYGVTIITWGTLIFELVLFTGFFMSKNRKQFLFPVAVGFHFLILILFGLFSFFFAMFGALVFYLADISKNYEFSFINKYGKVPVHR